MDLASITESNARTAKTIRQIGLLQKVMSAQYFLTKYGRIGMRQTEVKPKSIKFWHGRNSDSDLPWLNRVFAQIPEAKREAIGKAYNGEFLANGRVSANNRLVTYCKSQGLRYEFANRAAPESTIAQLGAQCDSENKHALQSRIDAMKGIKDKVDYTKLRTDDREYKSDCGLWSKKI